MDNTLGVGLVGTGWVAGQHVEAFEKNPFTRVVALCSSSREGAEAKRQIWDLDSKVYRDYESMLLDPQVQIISIATPNYLHAEQTIMAAESGKHVLIEKPPALNMRDLRSMRQAVNTAGVKTIVSFVLRWNPLIETIKEFLQRGTKSRCSPYGGLQLSARSCNRLCETTYRTG